MNGTSFVADTNAVLYLLGAKRFTGIFQIGIARGLGRRAV